MGWRTVRCTACARPVGACICKSVQRRHQREGRRQAKPRQYVATPANRSHTWCSCGALIRDGRCVSATCGKSA